MRLKAAPGDFQVREELDYEPAADGEFYVHVLRKEKLDTPRALALVAQEAGVSRGDIAFAGLKDRQGQTEQWITIRGRRFDFRGGGVEVRFKGRTARPLTSKMSRGNHFDIQVRDLGEADVERLLRRLPLIRRCGFPNYFDDQRFGCLKHGQGFAQRNVLRGEWETALHRLLARPSKVALTGDVKLKRLLERHWGDWEACASFSRGPLYGKVFQHLVRRPDDFRGALELMPTRVKLINAYAWQSMVWNRGGARGPGRHAAADVATRAAQRGRCPVGMATPRPRRRAASRPTGDAAIRAGRAARRSAVRCRSATRPQR